MKSSPPVPRRRVTHPWLYALPGAALPNVICCHGRQYELLETFKHDFFAATGLYRGPAGVVVAKINRVTPLFGLPMEWAGRFLARREIRFYRALQDVWGVPQLIGPVGPTGFVHAFVPGHPLGRHEAVGDGFFDDLLALVRMLHARGIAYVDLNKRQNILVGDDGRPYLIDFQIALGGPRSLLTRCAPLRWLLAHFQHGDLYHVLKHKRRLRPDQLTEPQRQVVERLNTWIRLHRWIARPLTQLRRRTLRHLRAGAEEVIAGSDAK